MFSVYCSKLARVASKIGSTSTYRASIFSHRICTPAEKMARFMNRVHSQLDDATEGCLKNDCEYEYWPFRAADYLEEGDGLVKLKECNEPTPVYNGTSLLTMMRLRLNHE